MVLMFKMTWNVIDIVFLCYSTKQLYKYYLRVQSTSSTQYCLITM